MKNSILIIITICLLIVSCNSKKHISRTHSVVTRSFDTIVKIEGKKATFIPIGKGSTETFIDPKTGIKVTHHYRDIPIPPSDDTTYVKQHTETDVETPDKEVKLKGKETEETDNFEKKVEGVPWWAKVLMWLSLPTVIYLFYFIVRAIKVFPF